VAYTPGQNTPGHEWFDKPDPKTGDVGLRFKCTMCGNCCTGPEGYVLVSDTEIAALAKRFDMTVEQFTDRYTHMTPPGRSLTETVTEYGNDCIFLDRQKFPGKAVCGVYEDRPAQCRTWPFWKSLLYSRRAWELAKRRCPGIDTGPTYTPVQIRIQRDVVDI
jgi:Fe-S-cluster containining protein